MMDNQNYIYSIAAPAFNEEDNIENTVREWNTFIENNKINAEIVITNDGSKDRTKKILDQLKLEFPNLNIIHFETNVGYGRALLSSIQNSKGKFILTIDSDGQFDISDLNKLIEKQKTEDYDLVTGFRLKKNDSFLKVYADRILNLIIRFIFNISLKDTNCALKLIRRESSKEIKLESLGYSTPTEIVLKINNLGMKYAEIGVQHFERKGGVSKLKIINTGWGFIKVLFYLKIKFHLKNKKLIN